MVPRPGYALTLVAAQYARICLIDRAELMNCLEGAVFPDRQAEVDMILVRLWGHGG